MVANIVKLVRVKAMLNPDPHLLIQQEQVNIIQQRRNILLTQRVISATCDDDSGVDRQISHSVAEARAGRLSIGLYRNELSLNNFPIHSHRFEVAKLVDEFAIALSATKVVNTVLNSIRLKELVQLSLTFLCLNVAFSLRLRGGITEQAPPWITGSIIVPAFRGSLTHSEVSI